MLRLLSVVLMVAAAFVFIEFVGAALEQRAEVDHAVAERASPALATAPRSMTPSLTPETSP